MSTRDEFMKKLLATFKVEAEEHLQVISSGLVDLEKEPSSGERPEIVETICREAHSLKGASRAVNLTDIEAVCRSMENIFAGFKKGEIETSPELFDVLYQALDAIGELVVTPGEKKTAHISALIAKLTNLEAMKSVPHADDVPVGTGESAPSLPLESSDWIEKEEEEGSDVHAPAEPQSVEITPRDAQTSESKRLSSSTVRIPAERLDSLLLQAEEILSAKLAAKQRASDLIETAAKLDTWNKEWAKIQSAARKADQISDKNNGVRERRRNGWGTTVARLLDFLEWNRTYINSFKDDIDALAQSADTDARLLDRMAENLLEDMKQILMLPFSSLLGVFPKMVRNLSRNAGKEIELILKGSEVEIDKRILEEIKDPLIHLLRNCVDHGVEKPDERKALGKPPLGRIAVEVTQIDSSKVEVLISDDGAGIDLNNVKAAAVREGIVSEKEADSLDEDGVLSLIYNSGVTTSPIITDISGRGLGLAIVREKIDQLDGTITLETRRNAGMSVRILLPLTLSAFRGVLVQAANRTFIVPTTNVERVLRIKRDEVKTIENKETIELKGNVISLVRLEDALELPRPQRPDETLEFITVVIIGAAGKRIAFCVDEIRYEREVLIKNLGRQLSRVRNIAGAMVQSTGEVVPVLNVPDLLKSAVRVTAHVEAGAGPEEPKAREDKSVLVVEDSITSRMLLKNILESSGYRVKTAVDGMDAMTTLKTEGFDLVVSDIDMPRMNGFDLTAKIRNDEKLSELPLILVTSLESREHRERGVDVGANAYIAKSSFDQSNLLETIESLI